MAKLIDTRRTRIFLGEYRVKIAGMGLVGIIALGSGLALGHGFHVDANEVAAAVEVGAEPTTAYREKVERLRAERERLHRIGKHFEAEQAIEQAAKLQIKK
jgi:hypothetical protein